MGKKGKKKKSKKLELQGTKQTPHPEELKSTAEILTSVFNGLPERNGKESSVKATGVGSRESSFLKPNK